MNAIGRKDYLSMMSNEINQNCSGVFTRDIEEKDLTILKSFIVEAWGIGWNLKRFNQNTDFFQSLLDVYLSIFLNSSTFGRVAVMNDKVVGAILGSVNGEIEKFRLFQKETALHTLTLLSATEAERMDIVEHMSTSFHAISKLLENRANVYDGSLEYIVVSEQARGLKIGKLLWDELSTYFNSKNAKSIYLIADSQCNVGFYDHNGFSRVDTKEAIYNYAAGQKRFDIYLYDYQF